MNLTINNFEKNKASYWQVLRLLFVLFFLYLLGDAFYRWEGFSYYGSLQDFLLSTALISVLWTCIAVLTAALLWLVFRFIENICRGIGLNINTKHLLLYTFILVISGTIVWTTKRLLWPLAQTSFQIKIVVFIFSMLISLFISWLIRNKTEQWFNLIQDRLTPLVFVFGLLVLVSFPVVTYQTLFGESGKGSLQSASLSEAYKHKPNIILVTFDALTASDMSLYGYEKDTTPFLSRWAENATVFTRAQAASNFTTSATASLMTGKRVWTHQTFHIEGTKPVNSHFESLPAVLKENGYFNMAFVVNPHTSVQILGIDESFDIAPLPTDFSDPASLVGWQFGYIDVFLYNLFAHKFKMYNWILKNDFILKKILYAISSDFDVTTVPPEKVFNYFLKEIDSKKNTPFFAWIHVFPPHDPYLPPEPYAHYYSPSSEFRTYKTQEKVKLESYKFLFQYLQFPDYLQPAVDLMRNYYDEYISYSDKKFGDFMSEFSKRKIDNTIIVVSADHGESFEHGYFTHGGPFLYEQVTHIPLVIKEPEQNVGRRITDLVEQIDIPATILELVDIPVPLWMEGRSLVPLINDRKLPPKAAFSMNFEENRSRGHKIERGSVAVWEGDYKLIHYLEKNKSLLFNLKNDPHELKDLFNNRQDIGNGLLSIMKNRLETTNKRIKKSR